MIGFCCCVFAFQFPLSSFRHLQASAVCLLPVRWSVILIYACCALGVCYVFIIAFADLFGCHVVFNFLVRWNDNMPGTRFGAVASDLLFCFYCHGTVLITHNWCILFVGVVRWFLAPTFILLR